MKIPKWLDVIGDWFLAIMLVMIMVGGLMHIPDSLQDNWKKSECYYCHKKFEAGDTVAEYFVSSYETTYVHVTCTAFKPRYRH